MTDRAILGFAPDLKPEDVLKGYTVESRILFSSQLKFSASQLKREVDDNSLTFVKGAPEKVLQNCKGFYNQSGVVEKLTEEGKQFLNQKIDEQSSKGYRIIALATGGNHLPVPGGEPGLFLWHAYPWRADADRASLQSSAERAVILRYRVFVDRRLESGARPSRRL